MKAKILKKVRSRLDKFLEVLLGTIGRSERSKWRVIYLEGLLSESERKTVSAICSRTPKGNNQAVHHLLHSSPWDSDNLHLEVTRMGFPESVDGYSPNASLMAFGLLFVSYLNLTRFALYVEI
ncbi:MAG: transposase, partial [candidate division Zixibacteria bacterium]|nr:transposase [Candidatus Tariuqbacter arcticus]